MWDILSRKLLTTRIDRVMLSQSNRAIMLSIRINNLLLILNVICVKTTVSFLNSCIEINPTARHPTQTKVAEGTKNTF